MQRYSRTVKTKGVTLCMLCQNCFGKCEWSANFEAVDGWGAKVKRSKNTGAILKAWVGMCPKFKPDRLVYELVTGAKPIAEMSRIITAEYGVCPKVRTAVIRYHCLNTLRGDTNATD